MASHITWNESDFGNKTEGDIQSFDQRRKNFVNGIGFLCLVLFVAVVFKECLKKFHFPHTVLLFVFGAILGVLDYNFESFRAFTFFAKLHIVIQLFLPVIIFDCAFGMNPHMFVMAISQCMILALPGFVFCATLNAVFAKTVLAVYKWDWVGCFLFGTILCATDSSAIIELLQDYGVSPSLRTIIEGESMLNNGVALVLSKCIMNNLEGAESFGQIVLDFGLSCLGAMAFGYIIATGTVALLRWSESDTDMEVTFTFCISYIAYFVSEIFLGISGILTLVVLGVSVSNYKSNINYEEEETTVHQFWQTLSFWANSLIFTIVGLIITSGAFKDLESSDIGNIIATYFMISLFRGCMILVLSPFLKKEGYGFSWKYGAVLTWGGMRGAIGLALALMSQYTQLRGVENKLLIQVSGVIVLTLIFNASTMRWLLKLLGMGQITNKNMESMAHVVDLLRDAASTTETVTRMDKYMVGADWAWVHQVIHIENPYKEEEDVYSTMLRRTFERLRGHCKECKAEIRIEPNAEELRRMEQESRLLIMRALKTSVANQHAGYGILRRTLGHLNTCIENTTDNLEKSLLAEDVKKKFLSLNYYVKWLKKHMMDALQNSEIESRQRKNAIRLRNEETGSTAFRRWCIRTYLDRRFEPGLYWILLINAIPIAGEFRASFSEYGLFHDHNHWEKEIFVFEILNAILALYYVWDATIRIGALGFKSYFTKKGNMVDFIVTLTAVVQIIYGIVLISFYRFTYSNEALYALITMSAIRIVRLLKVTCTGICRNVLNQCCYVFYNAFDLGIGFIVANKEIARYAHKIVEYEECAEFARFTANKSASEMLCYIDEIEEEHPHVVCAWRTHRAAIYILRNMKEIIEEMVNIYMIDETDGELLLEEVAQKMKDTLSAPRYLTSTQNVQNYLKNILWIKNDEVLSKIMENHGIVSFSKGQVIQDAGKEHSSMKILCKGIIQVSGIHTDEKKAALPNTDSQQYFETIGNFSVSINYPKTVGLFGYLLQTPSVTNTVASKHCQMIEVKFETIAEIERQFGDLSFHMWRPVALRIALSVLREEQAYENWSNERLKIHLEEGIFPNLDNKVEFDVHPAIADMVLVQGRVKDKNTETVYIGPAYIPNSVRSLILLDSPRDRPRVVMVLLREEKYHARSIMGWVEINEITYKGLCLVHGIRKASIYETQMLNETLGRRSFIHTVGQLFKPKGGNILKSDAP